MWQDKSAPIHDIPWKERNERRLPYSIGDTSIRTRRLAIEWHIHIYIHIILIETLSTHPNHKIIVFVISSQEDTVYFISVRQNENSVDLL
jgi:hypothetical protein